MNEEARPNFHAVMFTTELLTAYTKSLRGDAAKGTMLMDDRIRDMFIDFVEAVSDYVDVKVEARR